MLALLLAAALATPTTCDPGLPPHLAPPGNLITDEGLELVLEHTAFDVDIAGGLALVEVTQIYSNPFTDTVDASYVFPLPSDAAVHDLQLVCGERVLSSVVMEREEARQAYETARKEGRKAALLEQQRPNLFTQHVGGLCPGETVEVVLRYLEPVHEADGRASLTLPTTVGPRFDPLGAVEAQPPFVPSDRDGRSLDVHFLVREGVPLDGLWSDTHDLDILFESSEEAEVQLADADAIPNANVHLAWTLAGDSPRAHARWSPDPSRSGDGYLSIDLLPPRPDAIRSPRKREIVLVLDRSGSMAGASWMSATRAVMGVYDSLRPQDTINIVDFSDQASAIFRNPRPPSAATRGAIADWMAPGPSGGTWMQTGLELALQLPGDPDAMRMAVLITDGYIGQESDVFAAVEAHAGHARVFALGVGSGPNQHLLEGVAAKGRGEVFLQHTRTPIEETVDDLVRLITTPALTDVAVSFAGLDVTDQHPAVLPDLWVDRPLRLSAKAVPLSDEATATVTGMLEGERWSRELVVQIDPFADETLSLLWARRHLAELDFDSGREEPAQIAHATEVALEHGLVSRWTSRVVVDEAPNTCGPSVGHIDVPALAPAGMEMMRGGGSARGIMHGMGGLGTRGAGVGGGGSGFGSGGGTLGLGSGRSGFGGGLSALNGAGAKTPNPTNAEIDIISSGSFDESIVASIFRRRQLQLGRCYQSATQLTPATPGLLRLRIAIDAHGKVVAVQVLEDTLGEKTSQCIQRIPPRIVFPANQSGLATHIELRLTFSP